MANTLFSIRHLVTNSTGVLFKSPFGTTIDTLLISISLIDVWCRMSKFFKMFLAIALLGLIASPRDGATAAANNLPLPGTWGWCTKSIVNGCIQSVTTISPTKVETIYTDSSALEKLSMDLIVQCGNDASPACDGNKYETNADGSCVEKSTWVAGWASGDQPNVYIEVVWPKKSGWSVKVSTSTGNYRPGYGIGQGTTSSITTDDGDGTFTYVWTGKIETTYTGGSAFDDVGGPQDYDNIMEWKERYNAWWNTAQATAIYRESAMVNLWSRDSMLKEFDMSNGCSYYPFEGVWAEANANSFSWLYPSPSEIYKFSFQAQNYHYLPQNGTEALQLMPARIQVFLPAEYLLALGYSSLAEFDASDYSVTTEDGQQTSPTVTEHDGGLLINTGVQHYSSPNPSITFKLGSSYGTPYVTPSLPATKTPPLLRVKKQATAKSIATFAGLAQPKGSTVSLKILSSSSTVCRVSKSSLIGVKKGTCRIKVTVQSSTGTKKSKTVSLYVKA